MINEVQRIRIGGRRRYKGILASEMEERSLMAITAEIEDAKVILWGGEPSLRTDILLLLEQAKQRTSWLGIRTDGLIFQKPKLATQLKNKGLDAIIVPIPSLQADLNSWLLGKGFTKRALQAMKVAEAIGLEVFAEVLITRSGIGRIAQTVLGLIRQGCTKIILRPIESDEVDEYSQLAVLPRQGLLPAELRRALLIAEEEGVELFFEGLSTCSFQEDSLQQWQFSDREYLRCRNTDHQDCVVPKSYVQNFGWAEFLREEIDNVEVPFQCIEIQEQDPSRSVRQHFVTISETRPKELHILGRFTHPQIYSLLRDSLRLAIPEIWLMGDLSALRSLGKMEWFRLKGIKGLGHYLSEPSCSSEILELFEQTSRFEHRLYASVYSLNDITLYDQVFRKGKLPIAPYFILEGEWNIHELLGSIKTLSPEVQENFDGIIPRCLGTGKPQRRGYISWEGIRDRERTSPWRITSQWIECPKARDCVAFQDCCGIMNGWAIDIQPIIEGT